MDIMGIIAWILGSFVCGLNFYLSFIRPALHRWKTGGQNENKHISGFPLIGSIILLLGILSLDETGFLFWSGIILILLDTGGPHWFLGTMAYQHFEEKGKGADH